MQTAEFDVNDFASREAGDKSVYVKFYIRPKENEVKSAEEGRPIYEDKEYVEIRTPGNQTNIVQRPVTDMDKRRFAAAYREFKSGNEEQIIGTPLVEAPWITRSQVEELSYLRIRTVEQLANVGDDVCTRIPGLFKLKQRAGQMAERAEKQAPFIKMQEENDELRNRLEAMERTVQEQAALIADLRKPDTTAKPAMEK
jgi:hypothetical protein